MFSHMVRELFVMGSRFSCLCYSWFFRCDVYIIHALDSIDSRMVRELFVMAN